MNKQNTSKKTRPGKNNILEALVAVSLLTIFILVIIAGILSYRKLDQIIETAESSARPDRILILVKEINNNLSEAENSVKSFSLTRSEDYILRFYQLTESTGEKLDELEALVSDRSDMAPYIDTLSQLAGDKFTILDRLLSVLDEYRVQKAMQEVMQSIRQEEMAAMPATKDSLVTAKDTMMTGTPVKKEKFFSRLFKRKNKKPGEEVDTVMQVNSQPPGVSIDHISEKVGKVQEEVVTRDKMQRQEEWKLLQQDKQVMERIRVILVTLEEKEKANMLENTKEAEEKAGEIKMIIIAFGIIASFFILQAALVVYRYVKRNNEYKAVLEQARKDAEGLAKAKELFLANMSHEIRTPMNVISGFLGQVLKGPLDDGQREQLMIVKKSSDHLLRLLNDLLDLSKLQADKLELVEANFNPAEIIDDVIRSFEPAASAKKINLSASADPAIPGSVYGDPVRLRQVLFNLVGNALKFTDNGKVSIRSYPRQKNHERTIMVFEIEDTGTGMNESDMEKIFMEFEKLTIRTGSNAEGAGLGLAITRKLVKMQGGDIRVISSPGKGSTFTVEIPYLNVKENTIAMPGRKEYSSMTLKDLRILVVDDDEYNRRLARIILEKYECRVIEAASAEEAIEMIDGGGISLVLMDIHLPGMKGPEAAVEIKHIGARSGKFIPVIAVSATISKGDLESFRQSGLDDFILKPYDEENLLEKIAQHSGKRPDKGPYAGYDLGPLRISSGGSEEFVREMIRLFLKDTGDGLSRLKELLERKEWETAAELAHKMISPCRHLKAARLSALLKEIENLTDEPAQIVSAIETVEQARIEFDRIKEDIKLKNEL